VAKWTLKLPVEGITVKFNLSGK